MLLASHFAKRLQDKLEQVEQIGKSTLVEEDFMLRIGSPLAQTLLNTRLGFATQPHYKTQGELQVKIELTDVINIYVSDAVPSKLFHRLPWRSQNTDKKSLKLIQLKQYFRLILLAMLVKFWIEKNTFSNELSNNCIFNYLDIFSDSH